MEKTCFVIIGFGIKTDFPTGRKINLDATFNNIIKPVFEDLGILCFRSCDIEQSGVIDKVMYEHILKADFVIADISTLNPNAIYELGIRHALKPNTTIVMAEDKINIPFDINHVFVHSYRHLEEDIGVSEAKRVKSELRGLVLKFLENPEVDSPVYTFLPKLNPPGFSDKEIDNIRENIEEHHSTSDLVSLAEEKKNQGDFKMAMQLLEKAQTLKPHDSFIIQRLALITYKSRLPNEETALDRALSILEELDPEHTTDPETLGLLGAIYKRLYVLKNQQEDLKNALYYYERGFYVKQDYYNGINVAFLYALIGSQANSHIEFYANRGQAIKIWQTLIQRWVPVTREPSFKERGDQEWIYLTLAEAYVGIGDLNMADAYIEKAEHLPASPFALNAFREQQKKLVEFSDAFQEER